MKYVFLLIVLLTSPLYTQNLWSRLEFPDSLILYCLASDNETNVLYAGTDHSIFKSADGGINWQQITSGIPDTTIRDILVINTANIFAGTADGLYRTTNQGELWKSLDVSSNAFVYLTNSSKGDVFAGSNRGIYKSTDNGQSWDRILFTGGDLIQVILFDSESNIYSHRSSAVYRSFNYGLSWQQTDELMTGNLHNSIHSGIVTNNDNILIGTYDGGIFCSSDYGSTFEPTNKGLSYLDITEILQDKGNHIFTCSFTNEFSISIDDGKNWSSYSSGLGNNQKSTLIQDRDGYLLLGSYSNGIYKSNFSTFMFLIDKRILEYYTFPNSVVTDSVFIENRSDTTLVVSNIISTNAKFSVDKKNFTLQQGESIGLKLFYNATDNSLDTGSVVFVNNSVVKNEKLFITGYSGIPVLDIPYKTVAFGGVDLDTKKDTIITLKNNGIVDLSIDSIIVTNKVFVIENTKNHILSGDSLVLKLSFLPHTLSSETARLLLYTNNYFSPDTISLSGYGKIPVGVKDQQNEKLSFNLFQNYPNPFNPKTTISFEITNYSNVKLEIYNILGKLVVKLIDKRLQKGLHEVLFDGSSLSSGVYFYKLSIGNSVAVKKIMLIK